MTPSARRSRQFSPIQVSASDWLAKGCGLGAFGGSWTGFCSASWKLQPQVESSSLTSRPWGSSGWGCGSTIARNRLVDDRVVWQSVNWVKATFPAAVLLHLTRECACCLFGRNQANLWIRDKGLYQVGGSVCVFGHPVRDSQHLIPPLPWWAKGRPTANNLHGPPFEWLSIFGVSALPRGGATN